MTEEIKEILDNLYRYKDEDYMKYQPEDILTIEDVWLLLDYITNLQQENKAKTHQIEVLEEIVNYERNIRNDKLQQENEFLKLNNPEMNIEHFRIVKENKRKIDNLRKENKILKENAEHNDKVVDKARWNEMIYKSRIDKAIEELTYMSTDAYTDNYDIRDKHYNLLMNILNGSDENE